MGGEAGRGGVVWGPSSGVGAVLEVCSCAREQSEHGTASTRTQWTRLEQEKAGRKSGTATGSDRAASCSRATLLFVQSQSSSSRSSRVPGNIGEAWRRKRASKRNAEPRLHPAFVRRLVFRTKALIQRVLPLGPAPARLSTTSTLAMSTTPLTGLRHLLSSFLPSSSSTSFTLPVLPTPDALEFHLSPPSSPSGLSRAAGGARGREGVRAVARDEGSAPSTAGATVSAPARVSQRR